MFRFEQIGYGEWGYYDKPKYLLPIKNLILKCLGVKYVVKGFYVQPFTQNIVLVWDKKFFVYG